jgi:hypothetical protein
VPPLERTLVLAPHLQADLQGLLETLEALAQRREGEPESLCLLLTPRRADTQPGAPARQHVKGGHDLRQEARVAVDHPGHEGVQQNPFGDRRKVPEGGVGLEHALLGRAHRTDLPEVVHDGQAGNPAGLGLAGEAPQRRCELRRAAVPGEIGDVESQVHRHQRSYPDPLVDRHGW